MAAFSYQHPPFHVASVLPPNTTIQMPSSLDESNNFSFDIDPSFFNEICSSGEAMDCSLLEHTSCVEQGLKVDNEPSEKPSTGSSSIIVDKLEYSCDQATQNWAQMDKKRKVNKEGSPSISANSKEVQERRRKKQKKDNQVEEKQVRVDKKDKNKAQEEAPTGYVHVRARRGQATDSHSLAERVRREKISERMKMLQALVPGCDKVTGKALMLDEIINYVRSLQNQVEFLSMKLASLNPMLYNFGVETDALMFGAEDIGSLYCEVGDQRQKVVNQPSGFGGDNMYSF
ncbi:hypothetical protein Ancab_035523 [Ancistrocladus abbreviatus]